MTQGISCIQDERTFLKNFLIVDGVIRHNDRAINTPEKFIRQGGRLHHPPLLKFENRDIGIVVEDLRSPFFEVMDNFKSR